MDSRDITTRNDSFAEPLIYRHVAASTPCTLCRALCHVTARVSIGIDVEAGCGHFAGLTVKGETLIPTFAVRE